MAKIYCSNCGQLISDQSNFCKFCGAAQKGEAASIYRINAPTANTTEQQAPQKADTGLAGQTIYKHHLGLMAIVVFFFDFLQSSWMLGLLLIAGAIASPFVGSASFFIIFICGIITYLIVLLIGANIKYNNYTYSVSDDLLVITSGVLNRKEQNIPLDQIENVNIIRSILDRIIGVAQLSIETAGSSRVAMSDRIQTAEGIIPAIEMHLAKDLHDTLLAKATQFKKESNM